MSLEKEISHISSQRNELQGHFNEARLNERGFTAMLLHEMFSDDSIKLNSLPIVAEMSYVKTFNLKKITPQNYLKI